MLISRMLSCQLTKVHVAVHETHHRLEGCMEAVSSMVEKYKAVGHMLVGLLCIRKLRI